MTTEIDSMIRRGADLALAKERFPDIEPFRDEYSLPSRDDGVCNFMSASVTRECANHVAQGCGNYIRFGVRFGDIVVFEKVAPAPDRLPLSGILDRLSADPRRMRAIIAAGSAETWEAYQRREAEIASDEFARKVIGR